MSLVKLFIVKNYILSENFGSRYATRLIKGSKDSDDSLVPPKNLSQKMACLVGAQGQKAKIFSRNIYSKPQLIQIRFD